ncbi:hypothetical protein GCM10017744_013570 [Streptomyces antimycoticus]
MRVFQRGDPAQTPDLGLVGVGERIGGDGGHRPLSDTPQGRDRRRLAEGLDERGRRGQSQGDGGVVGVGRLVEREQTQNALGCAAVGQMRDKWRKAVAPGVRTIDRQKLMGRAMGVERLDGGADGRMLLPPGRDEQQPGPAERRRGGGVRQLPPRDAIAPGVDGGPFAVPTPPSRQYGERGQQGVDARAALLQLECAGEGVDIELFDGMPELRLGRVVAMGIGVGARSGRGEPVVLVLEGVGGEVDGAGVGVAGYQLVQSMVVPLVWSWARVWVRAWVSGCLWVRVEVVRGVGRLVGLFCLVLVVVVWWWRVWWVAVVRMGSGPSSR